MDTASWAAASQRWALAMHCSKAMSLSAAETHIDTCLRMAKECEKKGRSHAYGKNVAALYDKHKRMQLADKAKHGMPRLERERELCMNDTDVMEQVINLAVSTLYAQEHDQENKGKGKGKDSGKGHKGRWDQHRSQPYDNRGKGKGKDGKDEASKSKGSEENRKKD